MYPPPLVSTPERLTDTRFLNLFQVDVQRADGPHPWIFASRRKQPLTDRNRPDAVAMIVTVHDGKEPRLVVLREFRAPLGTFEIAMPSGLVDDGEDVAVAAARELFEETGLTLSRIRHVSPPVASSAGLTDETVSLVYGEATGTVSAEHLDQHEQIETRLLNIADVTALLRDPGDDVVSVRLYAALIGFVTAGAIVLPAAQKL